MNRILVIPPNAKPARAGTIKLIGVAASIQDSTAVAASLPHIDAIAARAILIAWELMAFVQLASRGWTIVQPALTVIPVLHVIPTNIR